MCVLTSIITMIIAANRCWSKATTGLNLYSPVMTRTGFLKCRATVRLLHNSPGDRGPGTGDRLCASFPRSRARGKDWERGTAVPARYRGTVSDSSNDADDQRIRADRD